MLKPNIQLFAEGGEPPATPPTPAPAPANTDGGQAFTADYVRELRNEAKGFRLKAVAADQKIRKAFGLSDDADCEDLSKLLAERDAAALKSANNRLVQAEVKALSGYDQKLLARVIDLADVKVSDKGEVTGVKEAAEAAAKEFPAVKLGEKKSFAPMSPAEEGGTPAANQRMNDLIRRKR